MKSTLQEWISHLNMQLKPSDYKMSRSAHFVEQVKLYMKL
jgi:hypothetical protein